jgi:hypothetical protein
MVDMSRTPGSWQGARVTAPILGTTRVSCPTCGREKECPLVQSINTHKNPSAKDRLLAGELNLLVCDCGRRTQLAATVLFYDPDSDYFCQVCPGGQAAMDQAAQAFHKSGAAGTHRIVPSLNALVEKVKLLAATEEQDLDRVLLFDHIDRAARVIHWMLFDSRGSEAQRVASSLAAYDKLAARAHGRPGPTELQIDRAWGLSAVRTMITGAN